MAAYDTHALKGFAQPWASVDALLQLSFLYVLRKILHFGYAPHFARARVRGCSLIEGAWLVHAVALQEDDGLEGLGESESNALSVDPLSGIRSPVQ